MYVTLNEHKKHTYQTKFASFERFSNVFVFVYMIQQECREFSKVRWEKIRCDVNIFHTILLSVDVNVKYYYLRKQIESFIALMCNKDKIKRVLIKTSVLKIFPLESNAGITFSRIILYSFVYSGKLNVHYFYPQTHTHKKRISNGKVKWK